MHHLKSHVYANWLSRHEAESVPSSAGLEKSGTSYTGQPGEPSPSETNLSVSSGIYVPDFSNHFMLQNEQTSTSCLPKFPILALVVSGGHTQILYMPRHDEFKIIGTTHDDAVGECFDKVAKILGLPYPGGPAISNAASNGNPNKYKLPHPKVNGLDFSFSGLKTAVLRAVQKEVGVSISYPSHKLAELLVPQQVCDFAASFQKTAVDILSEKLKMALEQYPDVKSIVVAGGVSANLALRDALSDAYFPAPSLSGDNGAMVAAACYYEIQSGVKPVDPYSLNIYPRISIEN